GTGRLSLAGPDHNGAALRPDCQAGPRRFGRQRLLTGHRRRLETEGRGIERAPFGDDVESDVAIERKLELHVRVAAEEQHGDGCRQTERQVGAAYVEVDQRPRLLDLHLASSRPATDRTDCMRDDETLVDGFDRGDAG